MKSNLVNHQRWRLFAAFFEHASNLISNLMIMLVTLLIIQLFMFFDASNLIIMLTGIAGINLSSVETPGSGGTFTSRSLIVTAKSQKKNPIFDGQIWSNPNFWLVKSYSDPLVIYLMQSWKR